MTPIATDLERVLASLQVTDEDEAKVRERARRANVATVEAWAAATMDRLPSWKWARFDNREWVARVDPRVIEAVRAWKWVAQGTDGGVVGGKGAALLAATGAGKSSAMVARLHDGLKRLVAWADRETIGRLPVVTWTTEAELVADQWAGGEIGNRAKRADVLVIDEVGFANGERAPTGKPPVVMDVVFRRYDDGRATSITSGLTGDQLAERYGTALFRRLAEHGTIVDITKG